MISTRIEKKINTMIDNAISTNTPIPVLKAMALSGYRSLGVHQLYKFGMGSSTNLDNTLFKFGNNNTGTQVGE